MANASDLAERMLARGEVGVDHEGWYYRRLGRWIGPFDRPDDADTEFAIRNQEGW